MKNARLVSKDKLFFIRCNASYSLKSRSQTKGVGHVAPDEERLVLLKPVVNFSFIYGVLRGLLLNYLTLFTSLSIYCENNALLKFLKLIKICKQF